jgi:hypothetical protein
MKVGIIGDATRAVAWERHLRPHQIVQEVELCPGIAELGDVDACFLVDESEYNLDLLLDAIHQGLNCFLVALQPTNTKKLETIYRASMEAGVHVQFSHWPTLAPATQWMIDRMARPSFLSITREIHYTQFMNTKNEFRHYWIDELGLCMKWVDSGIHHIEAKQVLLNNVHPSALHLFIRFDNGSTANINIYTGASSNRHKRISANKMEIFECDAPEQEVRIGRLNSGDHLFFEKQTFDPAKAAEKAALMFLKSVQMKRETPYTPYDAYQLSLQVEQVEKRLSQYR